MSLALAQPSINSASIDQSLPEVAALLAGAASRHDREGRFPHDNFDRLQEAGLLALTVPKRHGGPGWGLRQSLRPVLAIGGACASTGLVFAMQLTQQAALARNPAVPEILRAQVAADAVHHGGLLNALRVEPELGSPTRGGLPRTTLQRQPDGSGLLSGHKIYATGAPGLRWMAVWARDESEVPLLGHVLVPARSGGIRIVETWDHRSMRATASHDVHFDNVHVPASAFADMRPAAAWQERDAVGAAWNAGLFGALYTGIAIAARDWVVDFLRHRIPSGLGAPLATLPRMQEKVGEIEALLAISHRLLISIATDSDAGQPPAPEESGVLKTSLVENAARAVEIATSLAGNHAQSRAHAIERHLRDVLCGRVHVPVAEAAHTNAGRALLLQGLAR
jgi:alkylation response protein AidB-like acyl-CoA dehydrogenase